MQFYFLYGPVVQSPIEKDVPNQPGKKALEDNPLLHRFTIVCDREIYSPDFFSRTKEKRVACLTYNKFPGEDWSLEEFQDYQVKLWRGQETGMKLAERGKRLTNGLWVREVRKLTDRGHQTSILATDYISNLTIIGVGMITRWTQEKYFRYACQQFNLDRLIDYRVEQISDPIQVVNPEYRSLDGQVRSHVAKLNSLMAQFGAINLEKQIDQKNVDDYLRKKAAIQEEINCMQQKVDGLKKKRKDTKKHIEFDDLPDKERFAKVSDKSKHFIDTIKMITYRAETAMANTIRGYLSHPDEARRLLRSLYETTADLLPDYNKKTLTIKLHHMATPRADRVIEKLCDELNATETLFPRTDLRLVFKLGSS